MHLSINVLWEPKTRGKREKKRLCKIPSEHTIEVYLNFSRCIYADVNKRQITEGKNSSDKIEKKREYSPNDKREILNSCSAIKPKVWRKAGRIYRAEELCFYLLFFKRKISRSWLLPELFLVSFFLFTKRILLF